MQFSGPLPVSSPNPVQNQDLTLRLNQRLVAEVVEVSGTRVVLSVGGVPIVARLASVDQGAQIAAKRIAQFIVTALSEGEIELKLADLSKAATNPAAAGAPYDVTSSVLEQLGFEMSEENQMLARAMLSQHLTITPDLFDELKTFLNSLGTWGENEASLAAAIKAAGLPLAAGVLKFATSPQAPIGDLAVDLSAFLKQALGQKDFPPEIRDAIQKTLAFLDSAILDWDKAGEPGSDGFRLSTQVFGRSLENLLAAHLEHGEPLSADGSLLSVVRLLQLLKDQNEPELTGKVRAFLENVQQHHLTNVRLDPVPGQGEWCNLQFVLKKPAEQAPEFFSAQVRVARSEGEVGGTINGSSTRLLIQVDVEKNESIQVDLTFVGKQALAKVTTPNQALQQRSQEEMPGLIEKLQQFGYQLIGAKFQVGQPANPEFITVLPVSEFANRRVNIKV